LLHAQRAPALLYARSRELKARGLQFIMSEVRETPDAPLPDRPTLIAISALAYVLATALHEHLGHTGACLALGGFPRGLGAYYVDCDDARLSALGVRLVALAGPCVSILTGVACLALLRRRRPGQAAAPSYFLWLLGAVGLMDAAGYLLFSGASGQGDLGTTRDGALYGAAPEWLWRAALFALGALSYLAVTRLAVRALEPYAGGADGRRIATARRVALISYLTGGAVAIVIGLFNPHGIVIVVMSAIASSLGGTVGLLFMMGWLERRRAVPGPGLYFGRSWAWILTGALVTLAYGALFGPTLHP
jgi:hypothetical protein